jgi:hypothetical protein
MEGKAMQRILAGSLGWLLLWQGMGVHAEEYQWRPAASSPRVTVRQPVVDCAGAPLVALGRPVALEPAEQDTSSRPPQTTGRVAYHSGPISTLGYVVRGQAPDAPGLPPPPPPPGPDGGIPPAGDERYNCGVATENPGPGHPVLEGGRRFLAGIPWPWAGSPGPEPAGGRKRFQSDHCFDNFISPVTNPFLFEDPRSLTELRPVFIYQSIPKKNWLFGGGNIEDFALQGRLALTDRWSLVVNKLGFIAIQPDSKLFVPDRTGFSEIDIGPKYTFLRNDCSKTLGAVGLTFQIPVGNSNVFQDTGTLSLVPYLSMAQQFGNSSYGSFDAMGTVGYAFSTDNKRSEYLFTSLHLDYNIANANKYYPFVELNWFHYTEGGKTRSLGFEGADLINFGSAHVGGDDNNLSIAVGARYKFSECLQTGIAAEFPLLGRRDLMDFRLTVDLIWRY